MDPIGFGGGLNHYSYSNQNPVNFSDPAGNVPLIVAAGLLWGGVELGLSLWDLWGTGTTLADLCAPDGEKSRQPVECCSEWHYRPIDYFSVSSKRARRSP